MKPAWWIAGGLFAVVVICLFGTASEQLFLGWLYFPFRVLPHVTVDPPAALIGVVSLITFVALLHATMRWLRVGADWTWRSTAALSTLVLILFAAGTAMVGVVHQSVWLTLSRNRTADDVEPVLGITAPARTAAHQLEAGNHLKYLALETQNFQDVFTGLPPGGTMTADGKLLHGWMTFSGGFGVFSTENIDFARPWNGPQNDRYFKCNFPILVNPSVPGSRFDDEGFGLTHFAGNMHVLPVRTIDAAKFPAEPLVQLAAGQIVTKQTITDGTSNTLLVGTVTERFKPWGHPANIRDPALGLNRSPDGFATPPGWSGAVFAMCDGSTRAISRKIDPEVLRQLATPAGGEPITEGTLDGR